MCEQELVTHAQAAQMQTSNVLKVGTNIPTIATRAALSVGGLVA
jgi:hypothetical protein